MGRSWSAQIISWWFGRMGRGLEAQERDCAVVVGDLQKHRIAVFAFGDAQERGTLDGSGLRLGLRAGNYFDAGSLAAIGDSDDSDERLMRQLDAWSFGEADTFDSQMLSLVK